MPAVGQGQGKLRSGPATAGDLTIRSRYFRSKVSLLSGSHQQNITFATPMSCPIPNFSKGSDGTGLYLRITPPLRGESQKPSRQAKADAVGGWVFPVLENLSVLRQPVNPRRPPTVLYCPHFST